MFPLSGLRQFQVIHEIASARRPSGCLHSYCGSHPPLPERNLAAHTHTHFHSNDTQNNTAILSKHLYFNMLPGSVCESRQGWVSGKSHCVWLTSTFVITHCMLHSPLTAFQHDSSFPFPLPHLETRPPPSHHYFPTVRQQSLLLAL